MRAYKCNVLLAKHVFVCARFIRLGGMHVPSCFVIVVPMRALANMRSNINLIAMRAHSALSICGGVLKGGDWSAVGGHERCL
jgi:hypothetical protein